MADERYPLEVSHVGKEFFLGSVHGSLRDAIPALINKIIGRNGHKKEGPSGRFWALKDVSFHVKRGETFGIIGSNGAGKSTILKLLSRISKETEGKIHVRGSLAALIEVGAGFHPDLTGRENIYLNGTIMGLKRKQIDRLFDSIVEFSELEKFLDMQVKRYSSGMTVRLGFAIAAHVNPDILLVDEVLAVGDIAFQQKCFQRILELKAQGTTIIFISHNLESIQRLCDRVLLLKEGRVLQEGEPMEVVQTYRHDVLGNPRRKAHDAVGFEHTLEPDTVEIIDTKLKDERGEVKEDFKTGESLQISFKYRTGRPIENPSINVNIERIDGLLCHQASTQLSEMSWDQWNGEGVVTLDYKELNLLPNSYQVNIMLYEGKNPVPIARYRNQTYFHIVSDKPWRGTVHLEHVWGLQNGRSQ